MDAVEAPAHRNEQRSFRIHLLVLGSLALLIRIVYLAEYTLRLPFIDGPIADSLVYLEQADHISRGELGDATLLAFSPLYGYVLWALGAASHLVEVVALQLVVGCLSTLGIYGIAHQRFGQRAALAAGLLFLGYAAVPYYETKILSETLGLALAIAAQALLLSRGFSSGRLAVAAALGAVVGLAVLARASLLFAAPFFVVVSLLPDEIPLPAKARLLRAAAVLLGLGVVLGGNGAWNYANAGVFVPVIMVSSTIQATTSGRWDGGIQSIRQGDRFASSSDVVEQARRRLSRTAPREDEGPRIDLLGWLRGAPGKLIDTFSNRERTFQYGYQGERSRVGTLWAMPVSFGLLALLGLLGAAWLVRTEGWRSLARFLPLLVGCLATTTLYHPSTRYRLAMIVPLALLGGHAVALLLGISHRGRRHAALAAAGCVAIGLSVHLAAAGPGNVAEFELQLASSAAVAGQSREAMDHTYAAERAAPRDPRIRERAAGLRHVIVTMSSAPTE